MNSENTNSRRHYAPEEKVKILREHLLEGRPISEVCEGHRINPTQFYQWQKTFFENGAAAFAKQPHSRWASDESYGKVYQLSVANAAILWTSTSTWSSGNASPDYL